MNINVVQHSAPRQVQAAVPKATSPMRRPVVTSMYGSSGTSVPQRAVPVKVADSSPRLHVDSRDSHSIARAAPVQTVHASSPMGPPGPRPSMGIGVASASAPRASMETVDESGLNLLSGEHVLISLQDATIMLGGNRRVGGIMYMTSYRILFVLPPSVMRAQLAINPALLSWLSVPLGCIDKIEKDRHHKDSTHTGFSMTLICKDSRIVRITLQALTYTDPTSARNTAEPINNSTSKSREKSVADIERAMSVIEAYTYPNNMTHMFAFSHTMPADYESVMRYDTLTEFSRQGILNDNHNLWRLSDINRAYSLCDSYPKVLVVPRNMPDHELVQVASFRSGKRLPTLSWGDGQTGATLWRSAQPKSGVSGSSYADEKFLTQISHSCISKVSPLGVRSRVKNPELFIVDCRPRASAMANRAAGAGYENTSNYPYAKIEFYGIGNIHTMRDSQRQLNGVMMAYNGSDASFGGSIEGTQWLYHVRHVLRAGWESADRVSKSVPVLVHCSHGWDRTAQVCGIAQLFLDPYYRTFDGFPILVEKEFLSFGHPLQMRCGHGADPVGRDNDNMSPILLQFLDCVWQLLNQYPHYFEFNKRYVLAIAEHIYSCRFGTFLFNCDADRDKHSCHDHTVSIWTYLFHNRSCFYNPFYLSPYEEDTTTLMTFLPPPSEMLRNVTMWTDYWCRWASLPTLITPPTELLSSICEETGYTRSPSFVDESCMTTPSADMPPDLQLPFAVCSDSLWAAAYLAERERREQLDNVIGGAAKGVDTEVKKTPVRRASKAAGEPVVATPATTTRPTNEVVIDNLIILLRNKGIPDDEIRTAILHGHAGQSDVEAAVSPPAVHQTDNTCDVNTDADARAASPNVDSDREAEASEEKETVVVGENASSSSPVVIECGASFDAEEEIGTSAVLKPDTVAVTESAETESAEVMEEISLDGMDIRSASVPLNEAVPLTADHEDSNCADSSMWDI